MKPPRSFSILSLMLATAIFAMAVVIYFDRIELTKVSRKRDKLSASLGIMAIGDPELIHVRRLRQTHKMCWDFLIYVPPGKSCTFNFGDGVIARGATNPTPLRTREMLGSIEQQTVSLQIRRVGTEWWGVNDIGGTGQAVATDPMRYRWLSQVEEHQFFPDRGHGEIQTFNVDEVGIAWVQSETEYAGFDAEAGKPPRTFMAWIEPNSKN